MSNQNPKVNLSLLKPAKPTQAYLKMGIFGDTGSGKTWTAHLVALGLHKYIDDKRPIAMFDTETGSSYIKPSFDKAGIDLYAFLGNSLSDLTQVIDEAEQNCSVLIIDSISHVWEEYTDSYLKKSKSKFIELWDWKPIKGLWREQFTNRFINSKLHIIMCGRESGYYEAREKQKGGRIVTEQVRVGDKMKAESEVGYEPSLLCQMKKVFLEDGGKYARECVVIKERFNLIDSKVFRNPKFENFLPHIKQLNLGGEHLGIDTSGNSQGLFGEPNDTWDKRKREVQATIDKIRDHLVYHDMTSAKADSKKCLIALLREIFGTSSWTEIESMRLEDLKAGLEALEATDLVDYQERFIASLKEAESARKSKGPDGEETKSKGKPKVHAKPKGVVNA